MDSTRWQLTCTSFMSYTKKLFFFFQAEDGIRDLTVTGVQTCALPIFHHEAIQLGLRQRVGALELHGILRGEHGEGRGQRVPGAVHRDGARSEEHTSELQSQSNLVCRLLLEKKKIKKQSLNRHPQSATLQRGH